MQLTAVQQGILDRALAAVFATGCRADDPHFRALLHWALCGETARTLGLDYRTAARLDIARWRSRHGERN